MISAKIYTAPETSPNKVDAIADGLKLLGDHIGGVSVRRATWRIPAGRKIHLSDLPLHKLDFTNELHIFGVPLLKEVDETGGIANTGSGVAIVDSSRDFAVETLPAITAHESAHAIGFLERPGAHCPNPNCILSATFDGDDIVLNHALNKLTDGLEDILGQFASIAKNLFGTSTPEFCKTCRAEIASNHARNIDRIKYHRLVRFSGKVVSWNLAVLPTPHE